MRLTDEQTAQLQVIFRHEKARIKARDDHIRESWVRAMEARLVGEELKKCQKTEGVNHYENCRWLTEKYTIMLKENKVQGYRQIDV